MSKNGIECEQQGISFSPPGFIAADRFLRRRLAEFSPVQNQFVGVRGFGCQCDTVAQKCSVNGFASVGPISFGRFELEKRHPVSQAPAVDFKQDVANRIQFAKSPAEPISKAKHRVVNQFAAGSPSRDLMSASVILFNRIEAATILSTTDPSIDVSSSITFANSAGSFTSN
jgi:hypothetical protein